MKQQETTVLLGFLTLISFCLGHAAIEVQEFWAEAVIAWMVIVLPTGMEPTLHYTLFCPFYELYLISDLSIAQRRIKHLCIEGKRTRRDFIKQYENDLISDKNRSAKNILIKTPHTNKFK